MSWGLPQVEEVGAEPYGLLSGEGFRDTGQQLDVVYMGAVGAPQIHDPPTAGGLLQAGMLARDIRMIQDNVVVVGAADDQLFFVQGNHARGVILLGNDELVA